LNVFELGHHGLHFSGEFAETKIKKLKKALGLSFIEIVNVLYGEAHASSFPVAEVGYCLFAVKSETNDVAVQLVSAEIGLDDAGQAITSHRKVGDVLRDPGTDDANATSQLPIDISPPAAATRPAQ
jgi:hypothetical protein